jgi:P2 family phage contractile tail tube protein|uniref:Tail tube protein n=1 Tax=Caudovirales sp. ctCiv1 TaxID=2826769 RepID=A0A8S5M857_9CAUD|nr:phage major tail tube protein [uncultured Lachnoclostridium sp.]DAD78529.1 MAG TPA: tail tube protein [Caudovirales sp. ctCiv1]DAL67971.1 MAG TPA: tail tube protein [Caudoviricetes sp.]
MRGNVSIPEVVNSFNVYKEGNVLIGISGEVTLPDLTAITETLTGPGILGEIESVIVGHFGALDQEIPFRMLDGDIFDLANPLTVQELTLRASQQSTVKSTGAITFNGMRIVFRGRPKDFKPGTMKNGGQMGASITLSLVYILVEIDGKRKLELDKLNNVYKINDKDILELVKKHC